MSSSLIKAGYVNNPGKDKSNKRVIDSNQAIFDRIQLLNEIMGSSDAYGEDFADGFSEGLDAAMVGELLTDQDGQIIGSDEYYEGDYQADNVAQAPGVNTDELLAMANEEAENIIAAAKAEAENIIADANAQAEEIKARAYDDGMAAGQEAGYQEGLSRTESLEMELNEKIQQVQVELEEEISQLEPRFVEVLTDIYSHVFNVDLSDKTELILYLLKNTIRNIEGSNSFFVHVSADDYENVLASKEELANGLASSCVLEVIEDISLSQGGCFIEADSGIFDCSLGTELELLKKELRLLSYKGN